MSAPRSMCGLAAVGLALAAASAASPAPDRIALGPRVELKHQAKGHEAHLSGAALAVASDGVPVIAWVAQEGPLNHLYAARIER